MSHLIKLASAESESLLILMEFALHGSLKDYLKKVRLSPRNIYGARGTAGEGTRPLPTGRCLCPCHSLYRGGPTRRGVAQGRADSTEPHPASTSYYHDPVVMAHAARLMRILDSDYYHRSGSNPRGEHSSGSDSGSMNGDYPYTDDEGMCAYHSSLEDSPYGWVQRAVSQYYNSYYNYKAPAKPRTDPLSAEMPGSNAPMPRTDSLSAETPGSNAPLLPMPHFSNLPEEEEKEGDNPSHQCSCRSSDIDSSTDQEGEGEGPGVYTVGCVYCSERTAPSNGQGERPAPSNGQAERPVASHGDVCLCPDPSVMDGRLSYFEVLDYASQIARGMEHLQKMKVPLKLTCFWGLSLLDLVLHGLSSVCIVTWRLATS